MATSRKADIIRIYDRLYKFYGPQGWWPGRTRLEVIVGAILTQNTAWRNVEKAIRNLRREGGLASCENLRRMGVRKMARLIRPAGYYNVKSRRLKNFIGFLHSGYGGDLTKVSRRETEALREEFLGVNGIGPETCDSILLYAFKKPAFVVDAYTRRIFSRHEMLNIGADYGEIRNFFMENLPEDVGLFNEYHALIVRLGKDFCKTTPACDGCPLNQYKITCK